VGMGSEAVFLILINQSSMYEGISHLVKSVRVTDHYSPASATFETHERSYSNSMASTDHYSPASATFETHERSYSNSVASFGCDMFFTLTILVKRLSAGQQYIYWRGRLHRFLDIYRLTTSREQIQCII
jgi:hypothetical protein